MEIPQALIQRATKQSGVVSREQVVQSGLSDSVLKRLVRSGQWRRLSQGVYAIGPDSWMQSVWAGLMVGGTGAVVGLRAAAHLWNLPWNLSEEPPIDIFVGSGHRTPQSKGPWRFIRADRQGVQTPSRTSIARTIVDLGETLSGDDLATLAGQCVARRRVTSQEVLSVLDGVQRHPQRALLRDVLAQAGEGVTSALERRYLTSVERPHGLPKASRQAKPVGIYTVDNYYEAYELIIELDSQSYHRGLAAARDVERDTVHSRNGILTLRYTWSDITDRPCQTAREIAMVLARRGWRGEITSCKRCSSTTRTLLGRV